MCTNHYSMKHTFYLNLNLEMSLEIGEECNKDGKGEMKYFGDGGDAVLAEGDTQVLFDGCDEGIIGPEHLACIHHYGQQHLQ